MLKKVKEVIPAERDDINELLTYRALPAGNMHMEDINPFIFLNHHGPQLYKPNNRGLPFGPHPHRGIETVTFIIEGELTHKDSSGGESDITTGGIQWMTAGKGLIHAEVSSEEFKKNGGPLEILQLWLNLPKRNKMVQPFYKGLQEKDIPVIHPAAGVKMKLISGEYQGTKGAFESISGVFLSLIEFSSRSKIKMVIPQEHSVFFYIVRGKMNVNGDSAGMYNLVLFDDAGDEIESDANSESIVIFGHAEHLKEPIAARGPFVMNTYDEIVQAYSDYQTGKFR